MAAEETTATGSSDALVDDLRETAWFLIGDGDEGGKHYRLDRHNICGNCSGRWPCVEAMIGDEARRAADEIERLRAWKAEATEVIGQWEQVWDSLGRPGRLGESKAAAVLTRALDNGSQKGGSDV